MIPKNLILKIYAIFTISFINKMPKVSTLDQGVQAIRGLDREIKNGESVGSQLFEILKDGMQPLVKDINLKSSNDTNTSKSLVEVLNDIQVFTSVMQSLNMSGAAKPKFINDAYSNSEPFFLAVNRHILTALKGHPEAKMYHPFYEYGNKISGSISKLYDNDNRAYIVKVLEFFAPIEAAIEDIGNNAALSILQQIQKNGGRVSNAAYQLAVLEEFKHTFNGKFCGAVALTNLWYLAFESILKSEYINQSQEN